MTAGAIIGALIAVALVVLLGAATWEWSVIRWERRRDREGGAQ